MRTTKQRGDATLNVPGVDRRGFIQRLSASTAAAIAVTALSPSAKAAESRRAVAEMSHTTFTALVGSTFHVQTGNDVVEMELLAVKELAAQQNRPAGLARRIPFSLVFRAPSGTTAEQQIFKVAHDALGPCELFLVPVRPDDKGPRYEAVFN